MAWTNPKTWSVGETLTAANFNTHIRDNFNASAPHLIVRKTADQSVTSSTVFVNDTALLLAVAANEVWRFELHLMMTGDNAGDFKGQFTLPSGSISGSTTCLNAAGTLAFFDIGASTTPSATWTTSLNSTTIPVYNIVSGVFTNGGSAGNLQLQWAQNASTGIATIVKANSTLWAVKLA